MWTLQWLHDRACCRNIKMPKRNSKNLICCSCVSYCDLLVVCEHFLSPGETHLWFQLFYLVLNLINVLWVLQAFIKHTSRAFYQIQRQHRHTICLKNRVQNYHYNHTLLSEWDCTLCTCSHPHIPSPVWWQNPSQCGIRQSTVNPG